MRKLQRLAGEEATFYATDLAGLRAALAEEGFTTRAQFNKAVESAQKRLAKLIERREAARRAEIEAEMEAERREQEAERREAEREGRICRCGELAAYECPNNCCYHCCGTKTRHEHCLRHTEYCCYYRL
jgi:hypothetical protein